MIGAAIDADENESLAGAAQLRHQRHTMAERVVPHFHNEPGVPVIEIGAKEFMCVGATPPFDHPHIFLDMGAELFEYLRR